MLDSVSNLLLYLVAGTRGGLTRGQIISALLKRPMNAHQLAKHLEIDYKTAQYHLDLLVENNILSVIKKGSYGAIFLPSELLNSSKSSFEEIWKGFGKKKGKNSG